MIGIVSTLIRAIMTVIGKATLRGIIRYYDIGITTRRRDPENRLVLRPGEEIREEEIGEEIGKEIGQKTPQQASENPEE